MNNKEALNKLKELVGLKLSFDTPTPAPKPEPAAKPKITPQQVTTGSSNIQDILLEIASLREQVAILGEYTSLKEQYSALVKRVNQIEAGFSKMQDGMKASIALLEQKDPLAIAKEKAEKEVKAWHASHTREAKDKRLSKFFK